MKRKNTKSNASFARRKFLVEGLEPRCLLAGNVNVFVSGHTLFVQGDGSDNAVLIQDEGGGTYSVLGLDFDADLELPGEEFAGDPTTINGINTGGIDGEPLLFHGVTNDINVDLKGGNDGLGIGNNLETLNNLAEDCFDISFIPDDGGGTLVGGEEINAQQVDGTFFVPRNLIVNLGSGDDFTAISANVGTFNSNGTTKKGGVANINLGTGTNGAAYGSGTLSDDLLITGNNGRDNVCVEDVFVRDLLAVQLGDGVANQADLEDFDAGHVLVTSGKGDDQILMENFDLDRELVVVTGNGDDQVDIEDFDAQNVTVDTGAGNDGSPEEETRAAQPALIGLSSPVTVAFADITRSLVLVTGSGNDFATINNVDAHDIVLDTGSGNDGLVDSEEEIFSPISIYNVFVQGNVTFVTGSGNDFAYMHSGDEETSNIKGNVTVDVGSDNDSLEIIDQSIGKDLNVFLGSGNNNAGIGGGFDEQIGAAEGHLNIGHNLNIFGGSKIDNVGLFNLSVHNDLFADLGAGADNLLLGGNEGSIIAISRNATLIGGSGGDSMTLNFTNIGGNALIDAGSDNDEVSIDFCHVAKTATILMGSGNDELNIFSSTAKKLVARGGSGHDHFNNNLGITKNGRNSDGSVDVQEFEFDND